MNLFDWQQIPWQVRIQIRKKYGLFPSAPVKTIEAQGITNVEDDGMRAGDIETIAKYSVAEIIASLEGESLREIPVTNLPLEGFQTSIPEAKESKPKKGRPKKK